METLIALVGIWGFLAVGVLVMASVVHLLDDWPDWIAWPLAVLAWPVSLILLAGALGALGS